VRKQINSCTKFYSTKKWLLLIAVITCIVSYQVDAAALTITSSLGLTHTGNLVQNGSFENQASGGTVFYWATGT
jgi:hypothetical protein